MVRRGIRRQSATPPETNIGYPRLGLDPDNWWDLTDEDVIVQSSKDTIITLAVFFEKIASWASMFSANWPLPNKHWFTENGAACKILRTRGGGWQKGRFRFRLEFIPDDPEAFLGESDDEPESEPEQE